MNLIKNLKIISLFIFIIPISLICFSCNINKNQKIKAELTFKSISFASVYGANNEEYENLLKEINKSLSENNFDSDNDQKKLFKHFKTLEKLNLLSSPYIFIKINQDSVLTVYLSEKEYNKIKNFKHIDLVEEHKKIMLELFLQKLDKDIYYSNNIIGVLKIDGKSESNMMTK